MGIFETYSKREKKKNRDTNQVDVYTYDDFSRKFRTQVLYIWRDALGPYSDPELLARGTLSRLNNPHALSDSLWYSIYDTLRRERGQPYLSGAANPSHGGMQCQAFLVEADVAGVLDILDLSFHIIDQDVRTRVSRQQAYDAQMVLSPDAAIQELNHRFREHGIGYEFTEGAIIKKPSEYIHGEVTKPAILLLHAMKFRGAEEEFFKAHEHYRKGRYKEAIAEALKSFESTMKTICSEKGWSYDPSTATAKQLIQIILANGLVPSTLQNHFSSIRTLLESGLPTVRNKTSGHGQGPSPVEVPEHLASYALHMAAANIVFLVEAFKAMK